MSKYAGADSYIDPKTGVLYNRLGIADQAALDQAESGLSFFRALQLVDVPIAGSFDLAHLCAIHKHLFGDVYDWAGKLRTVDISKGETLFAHHTMIMSASGNVFRLLAREDYLQGYDSAEFADRAAYYLGEINVLHPFREGNGRAQREFIGQLARRTGFRIRWAEVTPLEMVQASIAAYHGNHELMARLIERNLVDSERERAIEFAHQFVGKSLDVETAQPLVSYRGRILGETDRYVIQAINGDVEKVVIHRRSDLSSIPQQWGEQPVVVDYRNGRTALVRAEDSYEKDNTDRRRQLERQDPGKEF